MTPRRVPVHRVTGEGSRADNDHLAEESPLEILVEYSFKSQRRTWAWGVTLRSPGHDEELAAGLLFGEHRIHAASDILSQEPLSGGRHRISLHPDLDIDPAQPRSATAACGFCGSPHLPVISPLADSDFRIARRGLLELPARLAAQQTGFEQTGALHAAALFNARGEIELLREDIGRHNAVDKITGRALAEGRLPLAQCGLLLSGRAGYELVQKAARAGIPFVAAIGAPTTLAADAARQANITLAGFLRAGRANLYTHPFRLQEP
jgi:FdhD protein